MLVSHRARKGFTLVELLVTISILAILATVSVVSYTSFIKNSAIEADESFVKQLNIFTDAYLVKHYANSYSSEEILKGVLDDSGVQPINLQSSKYGYDLWFKKSENKFELKENFTNNDDYIRVMGDIIIPPASSTGTITTTTTTTTTTTANNPPQTNSPDYEEKEPVFVLEDFGIIPENFTENYFYINDNAIHVGIKVDDGYITHNEIDLSNIFIKQVLNENKYKSWKIDSIQYEFGEVYNNKIIVSSPGTQKIIFNIYDPETKTELSYGVIMYVRNVKYDDGKIELLENLQYNLEVKKASNNTYNATIEISNLFSGIKIYGYIDNTENIEYSTLEQNSGWKEYVEIEIAINDKRIIIPATKTSNGHIKETFYDLIGNGEAISCNIIYRYFGYNGITIEKIIYIPNEKITYK